MLVLRLQQKALNTAPDGSGERMDSQGQGKVLLCTAVFLLQLELRCTGGWEGTGLSPGRSSRKAVSPRQSFSPRCVHTPSPSRTEPKMRFRFCDCDTPCVFCGIWCCLIMSSWHLMSLCGSRALVLSRGLLSHQRHCKEGKNPHKSGHSWFRR